MHKRIYKVIILTFIFVISLMFMSENIREEEITLKTTVKMGEAQFPLLYIKTGDYEINRLHGYSSNIDANVIREAMTPIDTEKSIQVRLEENGATVRKIKYEVRELKENVLLDEGEINALEQTKQGKEAKIKINGELLTGKEYAMKITASTETGKKIHYYTRIKYYETDYYLDEKMDFILTFQKKSMDKKKAEDLAKYLETNSSVDNSSFAKVNIYSSFENMSWGNLNPEVITEVVPTIKEFNTETAAVQLAYFIKAKTDSGTEVYQVKEFYRIRYTRDRVYLLNYERTMESIFDMALTSLAKSEFKVGITNETHMDLVTSGHNGNLAFVRQNSLWYYNLQQNSAVRVFSFLGEGEDYLRAGYDQHNIRILDMDEEGNIDFIVYGYMNRGDYEGKVALILYRFSSATKQIEELVYIPLETTYQILKEEIEHFNYVSDTDMFYFSVNATLYSYDIVAKTLKEIAVGIDETNFAPMIEDDGHGVAWIAKEEDKEVMTILDLENGQETKIMAPEKETIQIFGNIGANLIYGYVKKADIKETKEGAIITPAYQLEIVDVEGNIRKTYKKNNIYVVDVTVNDNIARLLRVKKANGKYQEVAFDSILSQGNTQIATVNMNSRVTELTKTEWYISLPQGFTMGTLPKVSTTSNAILKEDTTLYLDLQKEEKEQYYVYAYGNIIESTDDVTEAILLADKNVGVVVNQDNRLVWERGGRLNYKTLGQIKKVSVSQSVDSIGACLYMVLHYNHVNANASTLTAENKSIFNVLNEKLDCPLNLTGCTLDEVLYFISNGNPVIAMKDGSNAVLITGYDDSSVTVIDPQGKLSKMAMKNAEKIFKDAGNIFISYIN